MRFSDRYYKPLCTYATRFVPPVRAEELVQDTLMWVWENRTSLIPEMPLKSLLFTIVKNKSLNSALRDTLKNRIIRQLPNATKRRSTTPILPRGRTGAAADRSSAQNAS